jgi:hypothetical protein
MKIKQISDLTLSAYLSTRGHKLQRVEGNGYRSFFVFLDTSELEKDTMAFYNRETSVDALTFGEFIRNLKALAVQQRRS